MARVCAFCSTSNKPLTREHVYPNWLSTYFKKGLLVINEVTTEGQNRAWNEPIFQHKAKIVCSDCNSGWMSQIEGDTKPILADLIFTDKPFVLDEAAQRQIALWVQKTVLMLNGSTSGKFKIPGNFYKDLYTTKEPLKSIAVTMGWRLHAKGTKDEPLATFEIKQISKLAVDKKLEVTIKEQMADGKLAWAATVGLGKVVFQLFGHNLVGGLFEVGGNDERVLVQINPYRNDISWPNEWPIEALGGLEAVRGGM